MFPRKLAGCLLQVRHPATEEGTGMPAAEQIMKALIVGVAGAFSEIPRR